MNAQRMGPTFDDVLATLGPVWDIVAGRVVGPEAPSWCVRRGWDRFLLGMDEHALWRCEREGLPSVISHLHEPPEDLLGLCEQVRASSHLPELMPRAISASPMRRASPRKRDQVESLMQLCREDLALSNRERLVDVGSGHGHLTRRLAAALGLTAVGLERDPNRLATARELAGPGGPSYVAMDAVQDGLRLFPGDLAVGLHACGDLGDTLVKAAARDGADLLLVSCCLQKTRRAERPPLSRRGGAVGLSISRDVLGLTNLTSRPMGVEAPIETIMEARRTRYALRLLLELRGVSLLPGDESRGINRRRMAQGLSGVAEVALSDRSLLPPKAGEIAHCEEMARVEHGRIRRLSLPRSMLARPLELAIVLDRASALSESGHRVRVGTVFDADLSPRNVGIVATRS